MPHRILYIVNPISGTQRKLHIAEQALSLTSREVYSEVALRETAYAGHAEHPANLLPALENIILMLPLPHVGQGPRSFLSVLLVHLGSTHCMDGGLPFLMTFS